MACPFEMVNAVLDGHLLCQRASEGHVYILIYISDLLPVLGCHPGGLELLRDAFRMAAEDTLDRVPFQHRSLHF